MDADAGDQVQGIGRMPPDDGAILMETPPTGSLPLFTRLLANLRPIWLHWKKGRRGKLVSDPCRGQGCKLCKEALACRKYWYAPAAVWGMRDLTGQPLWRWRKRVQLLSDDSAEQLGFGRPTIDLLLMLVRENGRSNGRVLAKPQNGVPPERPTSLWGYRWAQDAGNWEKFRAGWILTPYKPFNPLPCMMRCWGLREWPNQNLDGQPAAEPEEAPDVIPFRKQA